VCYNVACIRVLAKTLASGRGFSRSPIWRPHFHLPDRPCRLRQ